MTSLRRIPENQWGRNKDVWAHGCCLYVVEEQRPGPIKVGIAEHPIRRLSVLQCGNPRQLHLRAVFVGSRADCRFVEGAILFRFSGSILRGEWIAEPFADVMSEILPFVEEGGA